MIYIKKFNEGSAAGTHFQYLKGEKRANVKSQLKKIIDKVEYSRPQLFKNNKLSLEEYTDIISEILNER